MWDGLSRAKNSWTFFKFRLKEAILRLEMLLLKFFIFILMFELYFRVEMKILSFEIGLLSLEIVKFYNLKC